MPKGSVPRDPTANVLVKQKRMREIDKARYNPIPKKKRPSLKESANASSAYLDAIKYPNWFTPRKEADPSKQWYGKRAAARSENLFREGLHNMATGMYTDERRTARDIRSKGSVKRIGKRIKAPVGKGGR